MHLPDLTPELLSPAGNWDCARAAVAAGADAIYFGLPKFNARLRADNFIEADLAELMEFLHRHGVKGFVTMNTLIFTSEMKAAEEQLRRIAAAGVDALIIQDLGLAKMARDGRPECRAPRLDPDDHHLAGRPRLRRIALPAGTRRPRPRAFRSRKSSASIALIRANEDAARSLRPRRPLRRLLRPMPHQRVARPAQRQPRRMRPGLPDAV